jgi:hypothetical protein
MVMMILLGLAAWIATCIIVEAEVFRDVREAITKLYKRHPNWWTFKLKYFVECHMCTGIWVAAIIALFVPPIVSSGIVGWGLTALAIKGIAHLFLVVHKLGEAKTDWLKNDTILNAFGPEDDEDDFPHEAIRNRWDCLKANNKNEDTEESAAWECLKKPVE